MADKVSNKSVFFNPFSKNNPVVVQILGICSVLAVTAKLEPAIVMGLSVIAVLAFSNVIISLIRNTIPTSIRIIVQLVGVAATGRRNTPDLYEILQVLGKDEVMKRFDEAIESLRG